MIVLPNECLYGFRRDGSQSTFFRVWLIHVFAQVDAKTVFCVKPTLSYYQLSFEALRCDIRNPAMCGLSRYHYLCVKLGLICFSHRRSPEARLPKLNSRRNSPPERAFRLSARSRPNTLRSTLLLPSLKSQVLT